MLDPQRIENAYQQVRRDLLAARNKAGHWTGQLSASALSTATAISALALYRQERIEGPPVYGPTPEALDYTLIIDRALVWLAAEQNEDGGWGDTDKSLSNIATTFLVKAAFHLAGRAKDETALVERADKYLASQGGFAGLRKRYGKDKTFAVPILTNCALAGLVDWREVSSLPFELACLPQRWFHRLNLPVVSYALPALIAIGQIRFHKKKPWNPLLRFARAAAVEPSLAVLKKIQPASGGFLEATPLTSFVAMSLIGCGRADHPVVKSAVEFLVRSVRPDGSWPIDTNLATWCTTLSINALASGGEEIHSLGPACLDWVLSCQHRRPHPYTGAAPGGWAWTDLSGGVPDADDTPGALLALAHWLHPAGESNPAEPALDKDRAAEIRDAAGHGVAWLLNLQNDDGGWPTFCRGWGALPFDRSGTDLTAHVIRALNAWVGRFVGDAPRSSTARAYYERFDARIGRAIARGFVYIERQQRADGSWIPLWFGNQYTAEEENPIYGTARVLLAYRDLNRMEAPAAQRGLAWLAAHQNADGGWGNAAPGRDKKQQLASSVEETSLAVESLLAAPLKNEMQAVVDKGLTWMVLACESKQHRECSPIGFYFAKLWYYETTYPLIFMLSALGRASRNRLPSAEKSALAACSTQAHTVHA